MKRAPAASADDGMSAADRIERALRACRLCAAWPAHCIDALAQAGRIEQHAAGAQVLAHEPLRREAFVVASGCLEVSRANANGKKFVLGLLGPGEIAALVRMLPKWRSSLDYYAHRDTVLVHLPADALRAVADSEPILWRDIAELMLERFVDNVGALRDVALSPLGQRVAATLVDMGRVNGVQEVSGLGLRLSQDELGALLGVSRQSINKELRGLEAAGVIGADYNRITIRDLRALTALIAANA